MMKRNTILFPYSSLLHQNSTPPIFKFGKILGSLVKENHYSTAVSLHRQMEFKGIASNLVTSNILINCFSQLGQNSFSLPFQCLPTFSKRVTSQIP